MGFKDTPLSNHAMRNRNRTNFIDKFNDFWMWKDDIKMWGKMGRPDPFDDGDVSVVQFMKAQLAIGEITQNEKP